MEYRYYRELKHNYLVFEDKTKKTGDSYQYRIAESGRIKGLVPCTERSINGENFFYYEIGSMQTLRDRYQVSGMNHRQLRSFLVSIKELLESLSEFLMGEEGLVFNSRYIYTDLSSGEIKLIFCPFFDEQKSFSDFTIELLELVDEQDEEATRMVYSICDLSQEKGEFIYDALVRTLESSSCEEDVPFSKEWNENEENLVPEESTNFYEDEDEDQKSSLEGSRLKKADARLGGKLQLLFSLLFGTVIAAMVYIRTHFYLNGQENMLSILVMLVSAITGVISFAGGLKALKGNSVSKTEEDNLENKEEYDVNDDIGFEQDFGFDEDTKKQDTFESYQTPVRVSRSFAQNKDNPGSMETMVLDTENENVMALFSRNLDKTVRIALDALPVTIGKLDGCVDTVITDRSISRIHCRITREGERIAIHDLGSTNGTFRNGVKLKPQQKTYIEEGDEIRLGRVCFDCR